MNTLEGILFFGGLGAVVIGLILAAIFVYFEICNDIATRICVILIGCGVMFFVLGNAIYDVNTLEYEHTEIVITIENKRAISHRAGKYGIRYDYFFYFNGNDKIEVDESTYNNFNKGDTLVIKKTYCYRVDRETGERTLEKVTYNE